MSSNKKYGKKTLKRQKRGDEPDHTTPGLDDETLRNVSKIVEIEEDAKAHRTVGQKIAETIAAFCGSMFFVYVHVIWFGLWMILNSRGASTQFDPFPYTFLTLVVSLEAIFLSTFILISQNHETRLAERRNHLDLQINMLAEQENTKMLELLQQVAKKVGVPVNDPEVEALAEPVEPEHLVEQILSATGEAPE
jgi:uncharacterized membrane protein